MVAIASAIPIMSIMPTIAQTVQSINNTQVPVAVGTANTVATGSSISVTSGSSSAAGSSDVSFSASA